MTISPPVAVSSNELVILKSLQKLGGKATPEQLARESKLDISKVRSSKSWLLTKNLITVDEPKIQHFELTSEGNKYAKTPLPERQLLELLINNKKEPMSKLEKKLDAASLKIAIRWAKMREWVSISTKGKERVVNLTSIGSNALMETQPEVHTFGAYNKAKKDILTRDEIELFGGRDALDKVPELVNRKILKMKERIKTTFILKPGLKFESLRTDQITKLTKEDISMGTWESGPIKPYEVEIRAPVLYPGRKHPYLELLDEVREILIGMGFQEEKGPLVECEFWNFDALFQAQDHPAREIHDTYSLKVPQEANLKIDAYKKNVQQTHLNGWKTGSTGWGVFDKSFASSRKLVLRSQTTAVSMRTIDKQRKPPIRMFCIDKVFRPDVLDAKHSLEFHQVEGIVLDEGLTLKHLFGTLSQFARELGFSKVKFKPGYFPFTEPSVEAFVKHEKLGWIEILGSGLFRPEVLIPFGIDYPRVQCLAWGIGIGRLAMIRLGLNDIRELHSQNLEYLRTANLLRKTQAK